MEKTGVAKRARSKSNGARTDTSPEKLSDKATLARYRELKKRYMKVVKENARLRKQLSIYEAWTDDKEIESDIATLTQEQMLPVDVCTACGQGTYAELDLGHLIIKTCDKCGYRSRHKVSPIRD